MKDKNTEFFFVYGTLKEGGHFAEQFDAFRLNAKAAEVTGFDLYNLGWFPGVKPGAGKVLGELHEYCEKNLVREMMDRIEGYSEKNPERSLFRRQRVEVKTEDGQHVEANMYVFNRELSATAKKIEDGIWEAAEESRD